MGPTKLAPFQPVFSSLFNPFSFFLIHTPFSLSLSRTKIKPQFFFLRKKKRKKKRKENKKNHDNSVPDHLSPSSPPSPRSQFQTQNPLFPFPLKSKSHLSRFRTVNYSPSVFL